MIDKAWGLLPTWAKYVGIGIMLGLAAKGAVEFLQDGPAIQRSNTARLNALIDHLPVHEDSMAENAVAIEQLIEFTEHREDHDNSVDGTLIELSKNNDYIICAIQNGQRRRDADAVGAPAVEADCDSIFRFGG